jgi:hypothetical protein
MSLQIFFGGRVSALNKWVKGDQLNDLMSGTHEDVGKGNARLHKYVRFLRDLREVLKRR